MTAKQKPINFFYMNLKCKLRNLLCNQRRSFHAQTFPVVRVQLIWKRFCGRCVLIRESFLFVCMSVYKPSDNQWAWMMSFQLLPLALPMTLGWLLNIHHSVMSVVLYLSGWGWKQGSQIREFMMTSQIFVPKSSWLCLFQTLRLIRPSWPP